MDGRTEIHLEAFIQSLARTLPGPGQVPYHFTRGGPVDDDRLVTRPPYAHLGET